MIDLSGRVVIVTGGDSGIARAGVSVAIWSRREQRNAGAVAAGASPDPSASSPTPSWPFSNDPVRRRVRFHRARFEQLHAWSWGKPPPPAERFK